MRIVPFLVLLFIPCVGGASAQSSSAKNTTAKSIEYLYTSFDGTYTVLGTEESGKTIKHIVPQGTWIHIRARGEGNAKHSGRDMPRMFYGEVVVRTIADTEVNKLFPDQKVIGSAQIEKVAPVLLLIPDGAVLLDNMSRRPAPPILDRAYTYILDVDHTLVGQENGGATVTKDIVKGSLVHISTRAAQDQIESQDGESLVFIGRIAVRVIEPANIPAHMRTGVVDFKEIQELVEVFLEIDDGGIILEKKPSAIDHRPN